MQNNKYILLAIFLSLTLFNVSHAKSYCGESKQSCGEINNSNSNGLINDNYWVNTWANFISTLNTKLSQQKLVTPNKLIAVNTSQQSYQFKKIDFNHFASREERLKDSAVVDHYRNVDVKDPAILLKAGRSALAVGDYAKAKKWLGQLLEIEEEKGKETIGLADALHEMGHLNLNLGKYNKAAPLFLRALSIKEKILTLEHPSVAATWAKLGDLYKAKNELGKAEDFYLRALAIYEKHSGLEEGVVADMWMDLGDIYLVKNQYDKAEKFYLRSKAIHKKNSGSNHPIISRIDAKLAEVFTHKGDLQKGENFYLKSIAVAKKTLGKNHVSVARALKNLADFYKKNKHYRVAERSYKETLSVAVKVFGEKSPFVAEVVKSLTEVYESLGEFKKAEELKKKTIQAYT